MSAALPPRSVRHGLPSLPPPSLLTLFCPRRSTQIKTYSWDNAQVLLVGNKCDMEDERVVSAEKGRQLAEHLGEHGGVPGVSSAPMQWHVGHSVPVTAWGCVQV